MRITIVASIAIETDGLTSSITRATVLFFPRRFTSSQGPPERRLLGRKISADCLRRMFPRALLVALTWGTDLGLLSSHSARRSENQKVGQRKNTFWESSNPRQLACNVHASPLDKACTAQVSNIEIIMYLFHILIRNKSCAADLTLT